MIRRRRPWPGQTGPRVFAVRPALKQHAPAASAEDFTRPRPPIGQRTDNAVQNVEVGSDFAQVCHAQQRRTKSPVRTVEDSLPRSIADDCDDEQYTSPTFSLDVVERRSFTAITPVNTVRSTNHLKSVRAKMLQEMKEVIFQLDSSAACNVLRKDELPDGTGLEKITKVIYNGAVVELLGMFYSNMTNLRIGKSSV